jgi:hypothetical protein
MTSNNKNIRAQIRLVERYLQAWDPIGVIQDQVIDGFPPTEYDSYAPRILGFLERGTSVKVLAQEFSLIRTKHMGLPSDDDSDLAFANGLLKWWKGLNK